MSKKIVFSILFSVVASCTCLTAFAENISQRTMEIAVRPLSAVLGALDTNFAIKVHERLAITTPLLLRYGYTIGDFNNPPFLRVGTGVGLRIFPISSAMETGFFIEPYFRFGNTSYFKDDPKIIANVQFVEPGLIIAYGWIYENGFSLNLGGEAFYTHHFHPQLNLISNDKIGPNKFAAFILPSIGVDSGFGGALHFTLGYSF